MKTLIASGSSLGLQSTHLGVSGPKRVNHIHVIKCELHYEN